MALKEGDRVQAKRDLSCGMFGMSHVRAGKEGVIYKVSWFSNKYSVRFDDVKCEDLTDEDIEEKTGWW